MEELVGFVPVLVYRAGVATATLRWAGEDGTRYILDPMCPSKTPRARIVQMRKCSLDRHYVSVS